SSDATERAEAANDLRSLSRKAKAAIEPLKPLLKDPSPNVQIWAAAALLKISPKEGLGLEVLSKYLSSEDVGLRREAARATGLSNSGAASLSPRLAQLLKDPNESIRLTALQAISIQGRHAAVAAPAVIPLLNNRDLAIDAADALGRIGPSAKAA